MFKKCGPITLLLITGFILTACSHGPGYIRYDMREVITEKGSFNTLITALQAAGMSDKITGQQALTLFAPTDHAFSKIPKKRLDALLRPENRDQLIAVLNYHMLPDERMVYDLLKSYNTRTLQGERINISVDGNDIMIDNATILDADILTRNGVIHTIDTVIFPFPDQP